MTHAMDFAAELPNVDADKFGFIGDSMGSNIAKNLSTRDLKINAPVNVSGAYPPGFPRKKLPPLLIFHGPKDGSNPAPYLRNSQEKLEELAIPQAVHISKGKGRNFDVASSSDATARAAQFLDRHPGQATIGPTVTDASLPPR